MMSFPCSWCPCPKSKLLVFSSNFFSAIQIRTVELKPREDIHPGTEGEDLTCMVEACHLWGSLVTECPSHWSRVHDGLGGAAKLFTEVNMKVPPKLVRMAGM